MLNKYLSIVTLIFFILDNPLECDCELRWYASWLKSLRDKDDEMMQKKRTVCAMPKEHREYPVQSMPLERMNCVGKNMERTSSSFSTALVPLTTLVCLLPAVVH